MAVGRRNAAAAAGDRAVGTGRDAPLPPAAAMPFCPFTTARFTAGDDSTRTGAYRARSAPRHGVAVRSGNGDRAPRDCPPITDGAAFAVVDCEIALIE